MIRYLSLFSGVGLLDLGFEMAARDLGLDVECVGQVEADLACWDVLAKHWHDVPRFDDVRTFDATGLRVDVIVGGFPCQDVSLAGRGAGLAGVRSGLWFEYLRIIREAGPRGVLIENVPGLVRRGLDTVVAGLDDAGYAVEATRIQAADVDAPQKRERLFVVAHTRGDRSQERTAGDAVHPRQGIEARGKAIGSGRSGECGTLGYQSGLGRDVDGGASWLDATRWPACRGLESHEWEPPRAIAACANRNRRLKQLGNAVVPQCAYVAARRLIEVCGGTNAKGGGV